MEFVGCRSSATRGGAVMGIKGKISVSSIDDGARRAPNCSSKPSVLGGEGLHITKGCVDLTEAADVNKVT